MKQEKEKTVDIVLKKEHKLLSTGAAAAKWARTVIKQQHDVRVQSWKCWTKKEVAYSEDPPPPLYLWLR